MNFPAITCLDDMKPAMEHPNFAVRREEHYTAVYYRIQFPGMFDHEDPMVSAVLREARGIVFDTNGVIASRPFHKFYNLNQHPETQMNAVHWNMSSVEMDKMDGSMVRPFITKDGKLFMMTKAGQSDVSVQCDRWLNDVADSKKKKDWLINAILNFYTPIFEWTSPANRIVLEYREPAMTLLAVRENVTGQYIDLDFLPSELANCPFPKVLQTRRPQIEDPEQFIKNIAKFKGIEGSVFRFQNGDMLKIKTEWYCQIHRTVTDDAQFTRHIIKALLEETLDDMWPYFTDDTRKSVNVVLDVLMKGLTEFYATWIPKILDLREEADRGLIERKDLFRRVQDLKFPLGMQADLMRLVSTPGINPTFDDITQLITKKYVLPETLTNTRWMAACKALGIKGMEIHTREM